MAESTPESVIHKHYRNSFNFMTPNVLEYGWVTTGLEAWELSTGEGLQDQPIWGVTVAHLKKGRQFGKSKCFQSERAARKYIEELKETAKNTCTGCEKPIPICACVPLEDLED